MKEAVIRAKAVAELRTEGWTTWCPSKVKYQETDIFGVFDVICVRGKELRFIQWTTTSNMSARKRKVCVFLKKTGAKIMGEVWGLSPKKEWRKERVF